MFPPTSVTVKVTGVTPMGKSCPGPGVKMVSVSGALLLQLNPLKSSWASQANGAVVRVWLGGQVSAAKDFK